MYYLKEKLFGAKHKLGWGNNNVTFASGKEVFEKTNSYSCCEELMDY